MRHLSLVTNPAIEVKKCSFSIALLPGTCFSLVEVISSGTTWVRERGRESIVCVCVCLLATAMCGDFGFLHFRTRRTECEGSA